MTTPKPWTYYNDGERCGIVLGVESEHRDGGIPSLRIQLASRGDIICVLTGVVLVQPGEQAFVALADDMRHGWTSDADEPMVLPAGIFVEVTEDLDATDGGHLAIVQLGGSLFPAAATAAEFNQLFGPNGSAGPTRDEINAMKRFIRPDEQPAVQSVESTQALAFLRYVAFDRKLREVDGESDAADALRDEMDPCWYAMSRDTRELAAWAIADVRSTPHEQTSAGVEPVSLRDIIAAFPGVLDVEIINNRMSPSKSITAELQTSALFDNAAFESYMSDRVSLLTLSRLHIQVERVSFICDVCKQDKPNSEGADDDMPGACDACWHATTAASEVQAQTEPAPRELVMQALDEPAASYWRAVQTARNAIDVADAQVKEALSIRYSGETPRSLELAWIDSVSVRDHLAAIRKALPDLPTTNSALDGGCVQCGETGC